MTEENDRTAATEFAEVFENAAIGMAVVVDGRVTAANLELCRILGLPRVEVGGRLLDGLAVLVGGTLAEELRRLSAGATAGPRREVDCGRPGKPMWVEVEVRRLEPPPGASVCLVLHIQDITARVEYQQRLHDLARRDPMTGLLNRRGFEEQLEAHKSWAERFGPGALLIVDVDRFKEVNTQLGHLGGDEVLRNVATTLRRFTRLTDQVGRWGGDEFAGLLPQTLVHPAVRMARRVVRDVREICKVTVSIGVAPIDYDPASAIAAADAAMYVAKNAGGDRVHCPVARR